MNRTFGVWLMVAGVLAVVLAVTVLLPGVVIFALTGFCILAVIVRLLYVLCDDIYDDVYDWFTALRNREKP